MNEIEKNLDAGFEATPALFHLRVERTLGTLQRQQSALHRSKRWLAVLAACAVVLCGAAYALNHLGVLYFLNERLGNGPVAQEKNVLSATVQSCDSALLNALVRDAYWEGNTLSLCFNIHPKDEAAYAFLMETDIGMDGLQFDKVWWKGEILLLEDWQAGKQAIVLDLPVLWINGIAVRCSWDWVQDAQGETLLLQADTRGMELSGNLTLEIGLNSHILNSDKTEQATLHASLPALTKEN